MMFRHMSHDMQGHAARVNLAGDVLDERMSRHLKKVGTNFEFTGRAARNNL
jgi:hypothetical protein